MSLLLCNSCLGWVELNHTRCPRCRHQVDLQQPEPTREQLVQRIGAPLFILGSVQLLRFDPPTAGILYVTSKGLLLGPVFSEVQSGEIRDDLPAEPGRLRQLASAVLPFDSLLRAIPGRSRESGEQSKPPASGHNVSEQEHQPRSAAGSSAEDTAAVDSAGNVAISGQTATQPIPDPVTTLMGDPRSLFLDQQRIAKLQLRRRQCQIHLWSQAPLRLTLLTETSLFRSGLKRLEQQPGWQGVLEY